MPSRAARLAAVGCSGVISGLRECPAEIARQESPALTLRTCGVMPAKGAMRTRLEAAGVKPRSASEAGARRVASSVARSSPLLSTISRAVYPGSPPRTPSTDSSASSALSTARDADREWRPFTAGIQYPPPSRSSARVPSRHPVHRRRNRGSHCLVPRRTRLADDGVASPRPAALVDGTRPRRSRRLPGTTPATSRDPNWTPQRARSENCGGASRTLIWDNWARRSPPCRGGRRSATGRLGR